MCRLAAILSLLLLVGLLPTGVGNDKDPFGSHRKAESENGGYHQAITTGMDAKYELRVTIRHGGPQVNHTRSPLAGRLDFDIIGNAFLTLNFIHKNIPFRPIATTFQKAPARLIAHPGEGNNGFPELNREPIMISADTPRRLMEFPQGEVRLLGQPDSAVGLQPGAIPGGQDGCPAGYLASGPCSIDEDAYFGPVVLQLVDAGFLG